MLVYQKVYSSDYEHYERSNADSKLLDKVAIQILDLYPDIYRVFPLNGHATNMTSNISSMPRRRTLIVQNMCAALMNGGVF